jgi:hypothetical protein
MNLVTINPNPLISNYLVGTVKAFATDPVTILDVGARGGSTKNGRCSGVSAKFSVLSEANARVRDEFPPRSILKLCSLGNLFF